MLNKQYTEVVKSIQICTYLYLNVGSSIYFYIIITTTSIRRVLGRTLDNAGDFGVTSLCLNIRK